ncbi:MAG: hypothetical protein QM674_23250 [Burkholderiaceae bacterium]
MRSANPNRKASDNGQGATHTEAEVGSGHYWEDIHAWINRPPGSRDPRVAMKIRRDALSLQIRHQDLLDRCTNRRYLPEQARFENDPQCPWGQAIALPAETR